MSAHKTIYSIIPNPEELLKLDLEDVAAVIMESLNSIEHLQLNRNDFAMARTVQEYPNAYRASRMLPKYLLHPVIAKKVEAAFQNAEYDTAVFQALREVEVAVRNISGFSPTDMGAALMRKAFDSKTGPLRDDAAIDTEKLAISEMFAGLVGAYKTPRSHRHVVLDAAEAAEIIIFASHLLKIADARAAKMGKSSSTVKESRTVMPRAVTVQ